MLTKPTMLTCAIVGACCCSAFSQSLKPGDAAPPLRLSAWIKGPHVLPHRDSVCVVDFWSPSSPQCSRTIPKVSELARNYRGRVNFLGVAIRADRISTVSQYVAKLGSAFDYPVAADENLGTNTGSSAKTWMEAAGMGAPRFVPTSFIVGRDGRIAWIGSTFDLPQVLDKVIAPDWNAATFAKIFKNQQERMNKQYVMRHDPVLTQLAAARASIEAKQYQKALMQLDALPTSGPKAQAAARYAIPMKLYAFRQLGDMNGYYAESRKASEMWADDPHILNLLAWDILDPASRLPTKDYALAERLAERAVSLSNHRNANLLDTLAWAYWYTGQRGLAISTETSALAIAQGEDKQVMTAALKKFSGS